VATILDHQVDTEMSYIHIHDHVSMRCYVDQVNMRWYVVMLNMCACVAMLAIG